jgi:TonB family protein
MLQDGSLQNLLLYFLQIMLVVTAASAAAPLLRLAMPRARLTYWRAVVLACLVLPLLPMRRVEHVEFAPTAAATGSVAIVAPATADAPVVVRTADAGSATRLLAVLVPWLLFAGIVGRTAWLGVGLVRLRRLRRRGHAAALDDDVQVLRRALAPRAELQWHDDLGQPVTFGLRRPVVLLPTRLTALPLDIQLAVVCHELLHVRRRDWLWTLAEESVRTVYWFHPAMRWGLAQLQLSREETIDRLVVTITGARRSYMNALMMFADQPAPAPATLFVRRHQLVLRMKAISQEVRMSPMRLVITGTALVGVLVGSSLGVVWAVPLRSSVPAVTQQESAQLPADQTQVHQQVAEPGRTGELRAQEDEVRKRLESLRRAAQQLQAAAATRQVTPERRVTITGVRPQYPPEAARLGLNADVTLSVTLNVAGDVTKVEATSWAIRTSKNDTSQPAEAATTAVAQPFVDAATVAVRQWTFKPADPETTLEIIFTFRASGDGGVVDVAVRGGSALVAFTPVTKPNAQISGAISAGTTAPTFGPTSARPGEVPAGTPVKEVKFVRVGGNILPPTRVVNVAATYPGEALSANVQGVVIIEARIATDGSIADARVLRSIPLLDQAALDAVRQWRYTPTVVAGEPVEVMMTVTVNFTKT